MTQDSGVNSDRGFENTVNIIMRKLNSNIFSEIMNLLQKTSRKCK